MLTRDDKLSRIQQRRIARITKAAAEGNVEAMRILKRMNIATPITEAQQARRKRNAAKAAAYAKAYRIAIRKRDEYLRSMTPEQREAMARTYDVITIAQRSTSDGAKITTIVRASPEYARAIALGVDFQRFDNRGLDRRLGIIL